ncbi:MAG: hypothetical protein EA391_02280 [Balneolaceae bacterium]|nr:MAG: hypothetical protein EA391_02280 [Balneolaceae bacterium]
MSVKAKKIWAFLLVFTVIGTIDRVESRQTIGDTDIEVYTLNGSVNLQGHAYSTSQAFNRRDPLGALTSINLDYSFMGFTSGLDIRYSTEDSQLRQSMNRFSFYGSWRWLTLNAGDVNPNYSVYSLQGTQLRGGEIIVNPGSFLFKATAGRVNRFTSAQNGIRPRDFSYERWVYAVTLGVGNQSRSHFHLSATYGRDDTSSFPDTTGLNVPVTSTLSPAAENVTISPDFQISLFDEVFKLGAQSTLSAFTRDVESSQLTADEAGIPSFLTSLYTPRNSTRLSFAGRAHTELSFNPFQLRVEFRRIQPGFKSMGVRQIRDDLQEITVRPRFRLLNNRITLEGTYSMSEDNLLGNRISTQENENIGVNTMFQLSDNISLNGGYNRFSSVTTSETNNGSRQLSQIFQLFPSLSIYSGSVSHHLSFGAVVQLMESSFPGFNGADTRKSEVISGTLNYSLTLPTGLSFNSSLNISDGDAGTSSFTTYGATAGVGYPFLNGRIQVNINGGASFNQTESMGASDLVVNENLQVNGNLTASYNIASGSSLRLNLRTLNNSITQGAGQGFTEMEGRLEFQQRF